MASAALLVAGSCRTYEPAPVDLAAHAQEFTARLPDAESVRAFVRGLRAAGVDAATAPEPQPEDQPEDRPEGPGSTAPSIDLPTARWIALWFNADLRVRRHEAGVAAAALENAGRWADPELAIDLQRVLESLDHPWEFEAMLGFTVPLSGRPGLERALAGSENDRALLEVRKREVEVLDALDLAWSRWSALRTEVDLLRELLDQVAGLEAIALRLAAADEVPDATARIFSLERLQRQVELVGAEAAVAAAAAERNELLGLPPDRELPFVPQVTVPLREPDPARRRARLPDTPRLGLLQAAHRVSERELELAIAGQWPELKLWPGFGNEDAQPRVLFGLSLPLPLWNGNAREIAEAAAARDVAAAALRRGYERAVSALSRAEIARDAAARQAELVETELVPLAARQLADGQRMAELGVLDPLRLLDALLRAHGAKTAALAAARGEAEASVELNSLYWPDATPEAVAPPPEDRR